MVQLIHTCPIGSSSIQTLQHLERNGCSIQSPFTSSNWPTTPSTLMAWYGESVSDERFPRVVSFFFNVDNSISLNAHQVVLHSMHKYQPRLHIVQSPDPCNPLNPGGYLRFTFPEAAFIAVTAYQNQEVRTDISHESNNCVEIQDFQSWPSTILSIGLHCHLVGQIHEDKNANLNVYNSRIVYPV